MLVLFVWKEVLHQSQLQAKKVWYFLISLTEESEEDSKDGDSQDGEEEEDKENGEEEEEAADGEDGKDDSIQVKFLQNYLVCHTLCL